MVNVVTAKRHNENNLPEYSSNLDALEVSVEPFNPATNMKKRRTGNATNVAKSAFEDTLTNFAEADELNSNGIMIVSERCHNNYPTYLMR
jgi:hypothetical protein